MHRRGLLKLASGTIAAACGAIVGVPGALYVVATARRKETGEETVQRVMPLKNLPVGRPVQVAITGRRRDAWTVYARETIGHVWLVRRARGDGTRGAHELSAFTTICPHLGCAVKLDAAKRQFLCPCHKAAWDLSGNKLSDRQLGHVNPAPRGLDGLECRIVNDEETGEPWIEVRYQKFRRGLTAKVVQPS